MHISSFIIENQGIIKLAKCDNLPKLMVIAGPNGTGKSTLLHALHKKFGNSSREVLYFGPHRNSLMQNVQLRDLLGNEILLERLMSQENIPNQEGIRIVDGARVPWSIDGTVNFIKHSLCQIEVRRQRIITNLYDAKGELSKDVIPDPWLPLRELTNNLLPHLIFHKIDMTDENNILCLWKTHKEKYVDYNNLSSGEKSIIYMLYPLLERQIKDTLKNIGNGEYRFEYPKFTILIDEPELHLHANLQLKLFNYFRLLASEKNVQVIFTTHSEEVVEHATHEELFLLRPIELTTQGESQLIQVAAEEERLHLLRGMFGSTSNITAMQSVLVIEGVCEDEAKKIVPDSQLYRILHPYFDRITLISGGGKGECIKLVSLLNRTLASIAPNLKAFALLDKDTNNKNNHEQDVEYLPVSMIENFLLDPEIIWKATQDVLDKTELKTIDDIAQALTNLITEAKQKEIERRVIQSLGYKGFRPKTPLLDISTQINDFVQVINEEFALDKIKKLIQEVTEEVDNLITKNQSREHFSAKYILDSFYKRYLHKTGLAKDIFIRTAARYAKDRKSVKEFFCNFFEKFGIKISN